MINERRLAHTVINKAIEDVEKNSAREDALHFLRGGPMLNFWCEIAGISAHHVRRMVAKRWPAAA